MGAVGIKQSVMVTSHACTVQRANLVGLFTALMRVFYRFRHRNVSHAQDLSVCTYDKRSKRSRQNRGESSETINTRLQLVESTLKTLIDRGLNGDLQSAAGEAHKASFQGRPTSDVGTQGVAISRESPDLVQLETELDAAGRLDIDSHGRQNFHGHSSGFAFLSHIRQKYGSVLGPEVSSSTIFKISPSLPQLFDSQPAETIQSKVLPPLPSIDVANDLVEYALENVCVLSRIVHRPTFNTMLNRIYVIPVNEHGVEERRFLSLLYAVLALGFLAAPTRIHGGGHECAMFARRVKEVLLKASAADVHYLVLNFSLLQSKQRTLQNAGIQRRYRL